MDWVKVAGVVCLSVYLILTGLGIAVPVGAYNLVNLVGVAAGVLFLFGVKGCGHCHHDDK